MAENVKTQLIAHLQVKTFALQLDESSIRDSEALLMAQNLNLTQKVKKYI